MREASRKVPGGKLVRIKAGLEDGRLQAPQVSGDFFLMPPEGVGAIEEALEGMPVDDSGAMKETLEYVLERDSIRLSGISVDDIVELAGELGGVGDE